MVSLRNNSNVRLPEKNFKVGFVPARYLIRSIRRGRNERMEVFSTFYFVFLGTLYHSPIFLSLSSALKNWMHEDLEQGGVYHVVIRIVLYKKNEGC